MASEYSPSLTIQRACDKIETFILDVPRVTVGSGSECTICDTGCFLAPCHGEILASGSEWLLRDCGASDGCFINGNLLENTHTLRHNDIIQMGEMILVFQAPAAGGAPLPGGTSRFDGSAFRKLFNSLEENISKVIN